ncbi:hypothetical protein T484DRAFT_1753064 [Baffinella frigidus]|nr:hypothetical protein T484DRAFT_1753064 [Cryptophyta sp. CCMP2293]
MASCFHRLPALPYGEERPLFPRRSGSCWTCSPRPRRTSKPSPGRRRMRQKRKTATLSPPPPRLAKADAQAPESATTLLPSRLPRSLPCRRPTSARSCLSRRRVMYRSPHHRNAGIAATPPGIAAKA